MKCSKRPNLRKYDGQVTTQPAYLCLNCDGQITTDYSSELGNSCSADVFNRKTLRFSIDAALTESEIESLVEAVKPTLRKIHQQHSVFWDGSNYTRGRSEELQALCEEVEQICEDTHTEDFDPCSNPFCEYCTLEN